MQALVDLGLPVGAALLALIVWTFGRALSRREIGPLECGLAAGLLAAGLQNLVDFSFEMGGVALPSLAALALLCRSSEAEEATGSANGWRLPRWALLGMGSASLALGLFALPAPARGWREETNAFAKEAPKLPAPEADAAAEAVLVRHPTSFVVALALADRHIADRQPAHALHWLNRAMYFRPTLAAPHLAAEEALAGLGRKEQALLEARLFFETSHGATEGLALASRLFPKLGDLERTVPETASGRLALSVFLQGRGRVADAATAARAGIALDANDPALRRQLASLLLSQQKPLDAEGEARKALELAPEGAIPYHPFGGAGRERRHQVCPGGAARGAAPPAR